MMMFALGLITGLIALLVAWSFWSEACTDLANDLERHREAVKKMSWRIRDLEQEKARADFMRKVSQPIAQNARKGAPVLGDGKTALEGREWS